MVKKLNYIIKRDGRKVKFDNNKITQAIYKAFVGSNEIKEESKRAKEAKRLTPIAVDLFGKIVNGNQPTVETMQNVVEQVLMAAGFYITAKAYILYRQTHDKERKQKQSIGVRDDLKLSLNQLKVMESRYLIKDAEGKITETPRQMFRRVAQAVAKNEKKNQKDWQKKFFDMMSQFEYLPAGGYLRTAGTDKPMIANCFVLPVEDSMEGIFDSVKWMALIHQKGGGTGFNFSKLRPKGDQVGNSGGVSSGPISFMKVFDAATRQVMQGGFKRGANMGILNIDHPDILDFITCKSEESEINNFNISVGITDQFMQAVKNDNDFELINPRDKSVVQTVPARNLFDQIVNLAWRTGDPGVIFLDKINEHNPVRQTLGEMISTNPCITGDTLIATNKGLIPMKLLENKAYLIATDQRVINKNAEVKHFPISAFYNQGEKQVYKLITKSGYELKATVDHKIMTTDGFVKLKDLNSDSQILIQSGKGKFNMGNNLPDEFERESLPKLWTKELGQILGWLVGDGWLRDGDKNCRVGFVFSQNDKEILKKLKLHINKIYGKKINEVERDNGVFHLSYHGQFFVKFFRSLGIKPIKAEQKEVPNLIFTATKESVIGFLQGIFSADGTVGIDEKKGNYYIRLTSKSEKLLKQVQLLLLNLGIRSNIYNRGREERNTFNYINKNGKEINYTNDGVLYELNISKINLKKYIEEIGFLANKHQEKIIKLENIKFKSEDFIDKLDKIEKLDIEEVFDITEDITHSFIAGGIVVSNCGEQPLHPFDVCNLGSINLSAFVVDNKINWKRLNEVIRLAVRFQDNGVDISTYPLPQIKDMAQANRRIGLGVMGFADMLYKLSIPYNSEAGRQMASRVMNFIYTISHNESEILAQEKGNFPNWKGSNYEEKGIKQRNLAITTIAPTGTISMVAECSSGIEPVFLLSYVKNVVSEDGLTYVNPIFRKALGKHFKDQDKVEEMIAKVSKNGSCAEIKEIPSQIKKVFVTAHDISWQDHVAMQAAFQAHTDNAVSKTINFPHQATISEVEQAYLMAWGLGCKGLTIYRDGSKSFQILQSSKSEKKVKGKEPVIQSKIVTKTLKQRFSETQSQNSKTKTAKSKDYKPNGEICPECGSQLQMSEGCCLCLACGFSKCSL